MSGLEEQIQKNIFLLNQKPENLSDLNHPKYKNFSVLSMLRENKDGFSLKTSDTFSFIELKEYEINKFDELNNNLSDISNFDLEKEEERNSSSFNSSEDDGDSENIEVILKKSKIEYVNEDKKEFEFKINKEFEEIKRDLLIFLYSNYNF